MKKVNKQAPSIRPSTGQVLLRAQYNRGRLRSTPKNHVIIHRRHHMLRTEKATQVFRNETVIDGRYGRRL